MTAAPRLRGLRVDRRCPPRARRSGATRRSTASTSTSSARRSPRRAGAGRRPELRASRSKRRLGAVAGSVLAHNGRAGPSWPPATHWRRSLLRAGRATWPGSPGHARVGAARAATPGAPQRRIRSGPRVRRRARRRRGGRARARGPLVRRGRRRPFPRTQRARRRRRHGAAVVEVFAGAPRAEPLAGRAGDRADRGRGRIALVRVAADPRRRRLVNRPPGRARCGGSSVRTFTVGLGRCLRPGARRRSVEGTTPAAKSCRPTSATGPGARLPDPPGPPAPAHDQRAAVQGAVADTSRSVYSGLIRVAPGRGPQRRPPDQPQPRPRRGRARRLGAQPRHPRERRQLHPRLDRGSDRRGPALLPRVAGHGARGGRAPHRAGLLRRDHRPGGPSPR